MRRTFFGIPAYEEPMTRRIRKVVSGNPKRGKSRLRFAQYRTGMTVQEYFDACEALGIPNHGLFDITWDSERNFIELYD
jgi:hypothetical protein